MIKCKSCKNLITKGGICPHCGKDNKNWYSTHKIATTLLVLASISIAVVSITIYTFMSKKSHAEVSAQKDIAQSTKFQEKYKIVLGEIDKKDKFMIQVPFTITNNSNLDKSNVKVLCPVYDKNKVKVGVMRGSVSNLKVGKTSTDTLVFWSEGSMEWKDEYTLGDAEVSEH